MPHARLTALTLLTTLLLTAGCLADLEREPLDTTWDAQATLHATPTPLINDTPTQATIQGPLTITPDATLELTGIQATLQTPNQTTPLTPVHATHNDDTQPAHRLLDAETQLATGDTFHITLLPTNPHHIPLPDQEHNLTAHLLYRYRDGDAFDAGRITLQTNLTPTDESTLGTGATPTTDDAVHEVIFKDLQHGSTPGPATVDVYHVSDHVTHEATLTANLAHGEGVAILTLEEPQQPRDGDGYLLLDVTTDTDRGIAVIPDEPTRDALPGPGSLLLLALIAAAPLARRVP